MSRFLNSAGQIDEAAIAAAVEVDAGRYAHRQGTPATAEQRLASGAVYRRDARFEQAERAGFTTEQFQAAECFVSGMLTGLAAPVDMSDYRDPAWVRGSYDRQSAWEAEFYRRERNARLAAFDAALQRIASSHDITRYLEAAE